MPQPARPTPQPNRPTEPTKRQLNEAKLTKKQTLNIFMRFDDSQLKKITKEENKMTKQIIQIDCFAQPQRHADANVSFFCF